MYRPFCTGPCSQKFSRVEVEISMDHGISELAQSDWAWTVVVGPKYVLYLKVNFITVR